jgi:hypothetical protein
LRTFAGGGAHVVKREGTANQAATAVERAQKIIGAALSFAGVAFKQHDTRLRRELRPDCARGVTWSMLCKRAREWPGAA